MAVATTGPDVYWHHAAEIAAVDSASDRQWHLAVPLTSTQMDHADPAALEACEYSARDVAGLAEHQAATFRSELASLAEALTGNTLAGCFPELAAAFLAPLLKQWYLPARWHDRFADIGALTAGAWGIAPTRIPSLPMCCRLWQVPIENLHLPTGQAAAVTGCFDALHRHTDRGAGLAGDTDVGPPRVGHRHVDSAHGSRTSLAHNTVHDCERSVLPSAIPGCGGARRSGTARHDRTVIE